MEDGGGRQKRRSPRAKLLMAATLEHRGARLDVTLRDLSADGALVEGVHGLEAGSRVHLHKNGLSVVGTVAWVRDLHAGIAFAASLDPEAVLRHVPMPKAPVELARKKRPGFRGRMSPEERRLAELFWGGPLPSPE